MRSIAAFGNVWEAANMTPERIAELRALCGKTTPSMVRLLSGELVPEPWHAEFIGAARQALPEALDEIERLQKADLTKCPACHTQQLPGVKLIKCVTCGVIYCGTCRLSRAYYHAHDCPIWRVDDEERARLADQRAGTMQCPACRGDGFSRGIRPGPCSKCEGSGKVPAGKAGP